MLFGRKNGKRTTEFSIAINHREVKVGTKMQEERVERKAEAKMTNGRIDEIMERLQRLEMKEVQAAEIGPPTQQRAASAWLPSHIILGFSPSTPCKDMEGRGNEFLRKLGPLAKRCLAALAPVRDGDLARVVFAAKKILGKTRDEGMPKWAVEQRSPEAGRRQRATNDAVKHIQGRYNRSTRTAAAQHGGRQWRRRGSVRP